MSTQSPLSHTHKNQQLYLAQLQEYLRIPSISTLSEHKQDIERASRWIATEMRRIGLDNIQIFPTDGHPFVFGERIDNPNAPTILIYGHYDVQPVDPLDKWDRDPFGAEIADGKIWARGASDNKGQHFIHLKAIESILATEGSLPINIKFLIEGEEESGSSDIEPFLAANKRLLRADSGLISDGAMRPGQPLLVYGLRGVVAMEIHVQGPTRDLHSGSYGGTVLNPIQALTQILSHLHDETGRVTIPGFYDRVRTLLEPERELLAHVGYTPDQWQKDTGAWHPWGEPEFTLLERIGARPTCEINGIWGGFQGEGVKTVIPSTAGAKVTMRLVPHQDPVEIARQFTEHIERIVPKQIKVEVFHHSGSWPSLMPVDSPEINAAAQALEETWGKKPVFTLGGGSLPVVAAFQRLFNLPFVLMPLGLDDNRHSPNEHLGLEYFEKGIAAAIRYYHNLKI
jgi:acetylornithine deacetylase/succinyl-diaminopimelate desuccinylase-like protein